MKNYCHLLLLAIIGMPMLYGCSSTDNDAPKAATYDAATFDKSKWE